MSELYHYGVLGMKWGVRKERTKPSFGERRQVRKLKGSYKSAIKGLQQRTRMGDDDRTELARREKIYTKEQGKSSGITRSGRERHDRNVQNAEIDVKRALRSVEMSTANQKRAMQIVKDRRKELETYVDSLMDKYGKENVKPLKTRKLPVSAGDQYDIVNVYKTGIRIQDFPIIGRKVVAKQLSKWEKEYRDQSMEEDAEKNYKNWK